LSVAKAKGRGKSKSKGIRIPSVRSICCAQILKLATRISPAPSVEHLRLLILRFLKQGCIKLSKNLGAISKFWALKE
jgi:hypothetical protein